jgi:hypothetical protein
VIAEATGKTWHNQCTSFVVAFGHLGEAEALAETEKKKQAYDLNKDGGDSGPSGEGTYEGQGPVKEYDASDD